MSFSIFDSLLYRDLMHDAETGRLFSDTAEIRAMLIVEGALAKVQGALGLIPEVAAAAIHRASLEAQIDPGQLAAATGGSGVPVPALVDAFRAEVGAPEHARYVHWGATSQDIMDTALILRLRQALALWDGRLAAVLTALAALAETHAELPMAGRTWGQVASPITFGQQVAAWGRPLLRQRVRLEQMRPRVLAVSLAGAAGTLSAMDGRGPEVRAGLAEALNLADPGAGWHAERDRPAEIADWISGTLAALGKMGVDLVLLGQSGLGEVRLAETGRSSTMPQKQNPVGPSVLVALARHGAGLAATVRGAGLHRQQRDAAAWMVEWLALPQLAGAAGRATALAAALVPGLVPVPGAMAAGLDDGRGLVWAEALSFALTARMPRPEAQAAVKRLCAEVLAGGPPLPALMARDFPGTDWSALCRPEAQWGTAADEARAFAAEVRRSISG